MSHLKERKEQVCLNCNAAIYGKFCHVCGQENIEPQESFWHLVTHFLFDLIHFDGKFFSTLKYLLFKPGFLPTEHLRGRRADYLHPIRLYIFVSAFFFLIIFSFYKINSYNIKEPNLKQKIDSLQLIQIALQNELLTSIDSVKKVETKEELKVVDNKLQILKLDTTYNNLNTSKPVVVTSNLKNKSLLNNFLKKINGSKKDRDEVLDIAAHSIPKVLFFAVPFYALFLFILYARNRKHYYASHLVFSIYLFSFTFLLILVGLWLNSLFKIIHIDLEEWISNIFLLIAVIYTYVALKNYYKQSHKKTILKFIILSFCCLILLLIALIQIAFFTNYQLSH